MEKVLLKWKESLILKDMGFNEPCIAYYVKKPTGVPLRFIWEEQLTDMVKNSDDNMFCTAPTFEQAIVFLEKKINNTIHIENTGTCNNPRYQASIQPNGYIYYNQQIFSTSDKFELYEKIIDTVNIYINESL